MARHLGERGFSVDVFTRRDSASLPEVVPLSRNARVVHLTAGPTAFVRKEELLSHMPAFTRQLRRWCLVDGGYDVLHANFFMSTLAACDIKRDLGVPLVVTFHALGRVRRMYQGNSDTFPLRRLAIEDRAVREADVILAECPQDEADLRLLYRARHAQLQVVPCGYDPAEFGPTDRTKARRRLSQNDTALRPSDFVVLQLGRMVPRKGVDNVIRGVGALRRRFGVHARLLVVGGEGRTPDPSATPEIGRLTAIAEAEGVRDQVTFVGCRGRDELRTYYAAADVFVTTPWYEPFGITPVEAMACGVPVIGSSVGGIKSTVRHSQTGYLVPPDDPDALAASMARLASDPALAAALGQQALARARAHYTWAGIARRVAGVYQSVAVRPAPIVAAWQGAARPAAVGASA